MSELRQRIPTTGSDARLVGATPLRVELGAVYDVLRGFTPEPSREIAKKLRKLVSEQVVSEETRARVRSGVELDLTQASHVRKLLSMESEPTFNHEIVGVTDRIVETWRNFNMRRSFRDSDSLGAETTRASRKISDRMERMIQKVALYNSGWFSTSTWSEVQDIVLPSLNTAYAPLAFLMYCGKAGRNASLTNMPDLGEMVMIAGLSKAKQQIHIFDEAQFEPLRRQLAGRNNSPYISELVRITGKLGAKLRVTPLDAIVDMNRFQERVKEIEEMFRRLERERMDLARMFDGTNLLERVEALQSAFNRELPSIARTTRALMRSLSPEERELFNIERCAIIVSAFNEVKQMPGGLDYKSVTQKDGRFKIRTPVPYQPIHGVAVLFKNGRDQFQMVVLPESDVMAGQERLNGSSEHRVRNVVDSGNGRFLAYIVERNDAPHTESDFYGALQDVMRRKTSEGTSIRQFSDIEAKLTGALRE